VLGSKMAPITGFDGKLLKVVRVKFCKIVPGPPILRAGMGCRARGRRLRPLALLNTAEPGGDHAASPICRRRSFFCSRSGSIFR
jgi:hypothetical protein